MRFTSSKELYERELSRWVSSNGFEIAVWNYAFGQYRIILGHTPKTWTIPNIILPNF